MRIPMKKILLLLTLFVSQAMIAQKTRPPYCKAPEGLQLLSTDLHIHTVFSDGSVWPDIRVQKPCGKVEPHRAHRALGVSTP